MRAGRYVKQVTGYRAFIPAPLPLDPRIKIDTELGRLLSEADRALGRLDGVATVLPNPDLFVSMYVRQEAVLSSQIEGTQSTLEDVLQFELDSKGREFPKDIQEVVNCARAMNYGLERLKKRHNLLQRQLRETLNDNGEMRSERRGSLYTVTIDAEGKVGLFQLEVSRTAGTGRIRTPAGLERGLKESLNRAVSQTPPKGRGLMSGAASKAVTRLWCVLVAPNLPVSCRSATARLWWGQSPTE